MGWMREHWLHNTQNEETHFLESSLMAQMQTFLSQFHVLDERTLDT